MFDLNIWLSALLPILASGVLVWMISIARRDVSIVDSLWSLMFLMAAITYALQAQPLTSRAVLVLALVSIWSLRLAGYITWRNAGEGEDRRYREIRRNNEPNFALKSLYLVFGLQGLLAWVISLPLLAAVTAQSPLGWLDYAGVALWITGMVFEAGGDWQLARFKADPSNEGKVMDRGLWAWTRHPNYFGDFCIWWAFGLIALSAGAWWSLAGPLVMSVLLMRVSGVTLLEKDIAERRPKYAEYVRCTNTFFPGPRKCEPSAGRDGVTAP